jgi:hypothetical protein
MRSPYDLVLLCKVLSPKGGRTKLADGLPHNKAATRSLSKRHHQNWNDIVKNWEAIRLTLLLIYGKVKTNPFAPHNRRIISAEVRHLRKLFHLGVFRYAKELSAKAREEAVLGTTQIHLKRGKDRFDLFLASTFSRALIVSQPKEVIQIEVTEAIQRITTSEPAVSKRLLRHLSRFVKTKVQQVKRTSPIMLALPQNKSCYERPAGKGGAMLEAYERYGRLGLTDEWLLHAKARERYAVEKIRDRGLLLHLNRQVDIGAQTMKKIFMSYYSDNNPRYLKSLPRAPAVCGVGDAFLKALKDSRRQTFCKVCPILQPDGKVRVATLHTSSTVWVARNLTALLLPYLKRIGFSRTMLRNEEVVLENNDPQALLYSADLSKSTDPISIPLAKCVLHTIINEGIAMPTWGHEAVDRVIDNYTLEHEGKSYETVCGALMGLGPGWTALSFINAFCAEAAGADPCTYKVCGDDLIGFWVPEVIERYKYYLERFRLKSNKSKSYVSKDRGVFCERFVVRNGNVARASPCVRIGEAVGARAIDGNKGLLVVDVLKNIRARRPLREAAARTSLRQALGNQPGKVSQGGGGRRKADATTYKAFVLGERLTLHTTHLQSSVGQLHREAMTVNSTGTGIRLSTLAIKLKSEEYRIDAHHFRKVPPAPTMKNRVALKGRIRKMRALAQSDKRAPITFSNQELKNRGYPTSVIRRVNWHLRYRRFGAAIEAVRHYDPVIPSKESLCLLDKLLPNWRSTIDVHLQPTSIQEVGENRYLVR